MADTPGAWGGLQIRLTIPEVTDVVSALSSVLDLINIALDIGLAILNVVRTFTLAVLNPLKALLDELIALCQSALLDLRRLGLYGHFGDFKLLSSRATLSRLKGGYAQYQRRMITRLTDRRDLTRPDFTDSSTVLALFVYTAVDPSFTDGLLDTDKFQSIRRTGAAFARLLGMAGILGRNTSLPVPVGLSVSYPFNTARSPSGTRNTSALQLALATSQMLGRDTAIVSWNIAPAPGSPTTDPAPTMPPGGFLVEVSCYASGFYAGWLAPTPASTGGANGAGSTTGQQAYSTGLYQEGDTGQTLHIMGGIDTVNADAVEWGAAFDGTTLRQGARAAFFFQDPSVPQTLHLPFGKRADGTYLNQKTFFFPKSKINLQSLVGGTYTLELAKSDLPLKVPLLPDGTMDVGNAVEATEVWVRVIAVTDTVTEDNYKLARWVLLPRLTDAQERVTLPPPFSAETKGVPSNTVKVTFPSRETDTFTLALQTALAVAILSRSDIVQADPVTSGRATPTASEQAEVSEYVYVPTGLEAAVRDLIPVVISNPQDYFQRRGSSPDAFTRDLWGKVVQLANDITNAQGNLPAGLITSMRPRLDTLINWRWSDSEVTGATGNSAISQTILESLNISQVDPYTTVLAQNLFCTQGFWQNQGEMTPQSIITQAKTHYTNTTFGTEVDAVAAAPMVYDNVRRRVWYARQLIPTSIYQIANEVLSLTAAATSSTGGWVTWRPFMGASPLSANGRILQTVEGFLRTASAGTQAVEDGLLNTISFLEQRVKEVQELILKIREYLDLPFQISIPDLVALPLLVNGTSGVISGLSGATNKPTDGPGAYAGGLVLMGGGIPSILTDLLLLILSQSD